MWRRKKKLFLIILLLGIFISGEGKTTKGAEEEFSWLPMGECQTLLDVLKNCADCDDISAIMTSKRNPEEWRAYFAKKKTILKNVSQEQKAEGALAGLSKKQTEALISYLNLNMPVDKGALPKDPQKVSCAAMPADGRVQLLEKCALCHSIGPILTQTRDLKGWMSVYSMPPHPELNMSKTEQNNLFNYLVNNLPLPISVIPKELQVGFSGT